MGRSAAVAAFPCRLKPLLRPYQMAAPAARDRDRRRISPMQRRV